MFSGTAQVYHQVCKFFVGSVCLLVRVNMVKKQGCRLLFASHIGHNVIRKESIKCGLISGIGNGVNQAMLIC
jgi:hypothetical protein